MAAVIFAALMALVVWTRPAPVADETVVVLPDAHGKIGGVVVRRGDHEEVLDTAYAASHIGANGVMEPEHLSAEQVRKDFGTTLAALPPKPESFLLYFVTGSDELTDASKAELKHVLDEMRKRPVPDLQLIGHTDTMGNVPANDLLSKQRAEKVRNLLVEAGIHASRIEVIGRGERDLPVPTADQVDEPRNRTVEVIVR
jgi:outer membrane protein OmpA-like peptidoglycan-associated protein